MELKQAVSELRKEKKRKFDQTIDLIVNLKGIDLKRDNINAIFSVPHKIKNKKICGFLKKRNDNVKTITEADFPNYKDKKALKNLVKQYDFFIAAAPLMPKVATTFGKVLGPAGKMPSPQLGILTSESDEAIADISEKISKAVKIRAKEASIKVPIAREGMTDSEVEENVKTAYNAIVNALPTKENNVRSVMIKLTMGKPVSVEIKP